MRRRPAGPTSGSLGARTRAAWMLLVTAGTLVLLAAPVQASPAQDDGSGASTTAAPTTSVQNTAVQTTAVPTTSPAPERGIVTTTLPESNADVGRIIPAPNSGAEPEEPGDRGGWQQLTLFLLVCAVILGMAGWVWWRSRVRRSRRREAGEDPVEVARREGGDVRAPRPPGIVD